MISSLRKRLRRANELGGKLSDPRAHLGLWDPHAQHQSERTRSIRMARLSPSLLFGSSGSVGCRRCRRSPMWDTAASRGTSCRGVYDSLPSGFEVNSGKKFLKVRYVLARRIFEEVLSLCRLSQSRCDAADGFRPQICQQFESSSRRG